MTDSMVVEFSTTAVVIDRGAQGGEVVEVDAGAPEGEGVPFIPCDVLCSGLCVSGSEHASAVPCVVAAQWVSNGR